MKTENYEATELLERTTFTSAIEPDEENESSEQDTDHLDSDEELTDDEDIDSDEDLHEAEAGNVGEIDAEKNELDGPANDLISQPGADDGDE